MSTPTNPTPNQVTQARHPWRATVRTAFAFIIGLAAIWSVVIELAGVDPTNKLIAPTIAASAAVTRILADPRVEALLRRFKLTSWLAAAPPAAG